RDGRKPFHSINYITSHDGFTLWDLVSYARKRNIENGEGESDGHDANYSCGYGADGPTENVAILAVRERQARNFLATLMLSIGTPMLLAGDEFLRTQGGNNNAYCQDNPVSWIDWTLVDRRRDLVRFVRELIGFRLRHPAFRRPEFFTGKDANFNAAPDISWFNPSGGPPDWARIDQVVAARLDGSRADIVADRDDNDFFLMFNASESAVRFRVCTPPLAHRWHLALDTARPSPEDIRAAGAEPILFPQDECLLAPRSMVILLAKELDARVD
ncbi:MAG TPA: glycogen debranching enzyme, partial [Magnetospirillaceae bacterium]|nr:glycogen debranching enzyme [Magnetospirillaceae bacterium]